MYVNNKDLNSLQLEAIEHLMAGKARHNFLLLQRPPGTGKTKTVTGLVTALVDGGCPTSGASQAGIKVKVGISLPKNHNAKASINNLNKRTRILVCAPSNTAVDDLAWRIHNSSIGIDGKKGTLNIVRLGNSHSGSELRKAKNTNSWNINKNTKENFLHRINIDTILGKNSSVMEKKNYSRQ